MRKVGAGEWGRGGEWDRRFEERKETSDEQEGRSAEIVILMIDEGFGSRK